jgi:AraC-like ligand binding domain
MRARRSVVDGRKNDAWSRYFRRTDLHGIEALHARFVRHRFSNHAHDYLVIGLVEEGTQNYRYRGARQTTPSGGLFLVNAGESHTGEAIPKGISNRSSGSRVPGSQFEPERLLD